MPTVDLPIGPIDYRVAGPDTPDAPTVVFVHGFLVDGTLWSPVVERLAAAGLRCVVPDWPLGSHRTPIPPDRALTPAGVAAAVLDLLAALDLHDVVLVGNDTGGAICQLALAGDTGRVGGLVLTNCDAFEVFPPARFVPLFVLARRRAAVWMLLQNTRPRFVRHGPLAFGPLLRRPRSASLTRSWLQPALHDPAIRRDITRFARGLQRGALVGAASWLREFDRPARIVWGMRDRSFRPELGRRLADVLPQGSFVEVPDATTFVSIDRPAPVAEAIAEVANEVRELSSERRR